MSNRTPSEIAEWLEDEASRFPADNEWHSFHRQQAATIRAQAEALKIATEALEGVEATRANGTEGYAHEECIFLSSFALARIDAKDSE